MRAAPQLTSTLALTFALTLTLTLAWSTSSLAAPAAPDPGGVLQMAGCPRQAGEYQATLEDRIVLDRLFLDDKRPEDDQLREAIGQQLKYLWGYYRNEPEVHARVQLVLSAEAPRIEVLKKTATRYGRDLTVAWSESGQHLQLEQPYQIAAARRGSTRAADPAIAVDYRIHFKLALCGEARPDSSSLPTMLPRDPWLMHWHVPKSAHRRLCYFDECFVTSPCNDDDYADLPHPFYHWYDWYPDRHGPDADGRIFDCRGLLKPGRDYFARSVKIERLASGGGGGAGGAADFEQLRAAIAGQSELRATILIGVLDHAWKELGYDALAAAFGAGTAAGSTVNVSARATELLGQPDRRERGTVKLLRLLSSLPGIVKLERASVGVEQGYLRAEIHGTLVRSGKPVRLRAFVGLTDIFGPTPPSHWRILRTALAEDQVIVYAGHSGIGENFRLAQIEKHLGEAHESFQAAFAQAPYQLIAFLSCYSYMYFGQDLVAAAGQTRAGRQFVYTGTGFTKGDEGGMAVLDFVDQVIAGEKAPGFRFVEAADFLMVKRVDGSGGR